MARNDDKGANLRGEAQCKSRGNCCRHPSHRAGIGITKTDVSVCAECVLRQAQFPGGCGGCCPAPCAPCAGGGGGGRSGNMVTCAGLRVNEAMWLIKKIFDELQCFYHPSTGFCPA